MSYSIKHSVILTPITPVAGVNESGEVGLAFRDWVNGQMSEGDVFFWDCNEKHLLRNPKYMGMVLRCAPSQKPNNNFFYKVKKSPQVRVHKIICVGGQRIDKWCKNIVSHKRVVKHSTNITLTLSKEYKTYSWQRWKKNHGYATDRDGSSGTYVIAKKRVINECYFNKKDKFFINSPEFIVGTSLLYKN